VTLGSDTAQQDTPTRSALRPEFIFILSSISLYIGAALAVDVFNAVPPVGVAWLRTVGAAVVLVAVRRPWRSPWTRRRALLCLVFGTTLTAMNILFYLSISFIPLGTAVAVEFLGPIAVAAVGARTRGAVVALLLAIVGIVLLRRPGATGELQGVLYALAAGACWAAYIVLGKRVSNNTARLDSLAVSMALGALATAPLGIPLAWPAFAHGALLAQCLFVGVLASAVPYMLDQVVLKRVTASHFAVLLALLPACATVMGFITLGQRPGLRELAGIALVIGAVVIRGKTAVSAP